MIWCNFPCTSSLDQFIRKLFWLISKPDVATPPALEALPGANKIPASWKISIASAVLGIFAPSLTPIQPFFTNFLASFASNSFCVADGKAISHFTAHGRFPALYSLLPYSLAYSLIRPRRLFFKSMM